MRRLLLPALLLLLSACAVGSTRVPEPDRPGLAVEAHDSATGELLWRTEMTPATAAVEPLLTAGVVLVPAGALVAYDARDGERLWTLDDAPVQPLLAGELVVLPRERSVEAVDARTGRSLWRRPLLAGERVFAGPAGVALLSEAGVRLLTPQGADAWQVDVAGIPMQAHPGDGMVAVTGLRGDVVALDATSGGQLWRARTPEATVVLVTADTVLARIGGGVIAFDRRTGAQRWRQAADSSGAPLQVVGGRVLAVQHGGRSRVLALADGDVLAEPSARDVELLTDGLVLAKADELRFDGPDRGWIATVSTGDRPALWTDADDDVVVAVVGWGQPPERD